MDAERLGHGGLRLPAQYLLNGQSSHCFQGGSASFASHTTQYSQTQLE
jgi:hypothetical protein